ncbi:hypothetical protein B7463_g11512, partial [Scytalidium lignicola]
MSTRKTCDVCKARKVRCIRSSDNDQNSPTTVLSADIPSIQLQTSPQDQDTAGSSIVDSSIYDSPDGLQVDQGHSPPRIYIDLLLEDRNVAGRQQSHELLFKRNDRFDKGWSALYFTVLALGCQYHGDGTFDLGKGRPWHYFQIALEDLPDILIPMDHLINAQAMAAMAIFSLNFSCIEVWELLATEAARIALAMDLHQSVGNPEAQRTFWVIYCIEKEFCFYAARASTILDFDVGCAVPDPHEDSFGDFNWLLCYVRYALSSTSDYYVKINKIRSQLDAWKDSIPLNLRPGHSVPRNENFQPASKYLTVKLHYSYYHMVIALSRLKLHVFKDGDEEILLACKSDLMHSARCIIDLTEHIEIAHYTALWVLGIAPLAALFILFDFVIHNPHHPETKKNLAFLDIVAGYFTRLEFSSEGTLPSALLAEFTHFARQYVQDIQSVQGNLLDNEITQGHETQTRLSTMSLSSPNITPSDPISQEFLSYPNMDQFGATPEGHPGFDVSNLFGWSLAEFNISGFETCLDSGHLDNRTLRDSHNL